MKTSPLQILRLSALTFALVGIVNLLGASPFTNGVRRTSARSLPDSSSPSDLNRAATLSWESNAPQPELSEAFGKLPLTFEANHGQADPRVKFISHTNGGSLMLTSTEAILRIESSPNSNLELQVQKAGSYSKQRGTSRMQVGSLRMTLVGAKASATPVGLDELPGRSNYFIGNDPNKWRVNVPTYAKVKYEQVYRGVNLIYYGRDGQIEYDFNVAPGASYKAIRLRFSRAKRIVIDESGDLIIHTSAGELRQHKPRVYQESHGVKHEVAGRYEIKATHEIGFHLGNYDKSRPLVIDPVLSYSTFLGGSFLDQARAIATDASGNVYVMGDTRSNDFPLANPFRTEVGLGDVFIAKLSTKTNTLLFSTYLGGNNWDTGFAMAVDPSGNAYITGETQSADFPSTGGISRRPTVIDSEAFVTKLSASGNMLYSNLIGGAKPDGARGIAVDVEGNAYIVGDTLSDDFPTTAGAFQTAKDDIRAVFVLKLNASGTKIVYSSYLGSRDAAIGVAIDFADNAYIIGAAGRGFPTTPGAFKTEGGNAFVAKLDAAGGKLLYSTFLGGERLYFNVSGIAVDSEGNAYVTGSAGLDLPTTRDAFQRTHAGDYDGFVMKLNTEGSGLVYCTYLGGSGDDHCNSITLDSAGNAYVTGYTSSIDFPLASPFQERMGSGPISKSMDGSNNWEFFNKGLPANFVNGLAIDPLDASTVYASTFTKGVLKSTDGGNNWVSINNGLTTSYALAVIIDPLTPSTLYTATYAGVFKSTDGGSHWDATGLAGAPVLALVISPLAPDQLYASGSSGVLKSSDGGISWRSAGLNDLLVSFIAIDPANPSTLYASTESTTAGDSYEEPLGALPLYPRGVWKTTDGGETWSLTGFARTRVSLIAVDPATPSTLYAITNELMKSTDGGATWNATGTGLPSSVLVLAIDPTNTSTLYAGISANSIVGGISLGGGVHKSVNGGASWSATGLARLTVSALAIVPSNPSVLYAGTSRGANAFITKLNGRGSALVYSTYLGGNNFDYGAGTAVDGLGNAYVAGYTGSPNFPIVTALQLGLNGISNAFIAKISLLPRINKILFSGNHMIVMGEGFDDGAVILINSEKQRTQNDATNPTTILIGRKTGKKIDPGQQVTIQVRNSDGSLSEPFSFTRSS